MKTKSIAVLLAAACHAGLAAAAAPPADVTDFEIERLPYGSGTPADGVVTGTESARAVIDGLYHVPNYMPGYPTAASIWPRELPVDCDIVGSDGTSHCSGYRVLPTVGRGEYIFVRPYAKPAPPPVAAPQKKVEPAPEPAPVTRKKPLE